MPKSVCMSGPLHVSRRPPKAHVEAPNDEDAGRYVEATGSVNGFVPGYCLKSRIQISHCMGSLAEPYGGYVEQLVYLSVLESHRQPHLNGGVILSEANRFLIGKVSQEGEHYHVTHGEKQ
jgi:hypothetical protein